MILKIFGLDVAPASERKNVYKDIYMYIKNYCPLLPGKELKPLLLVTHKSARVHRSNRVTRYKLCSSSKNTKKPYILHTLLIFPFYLKENY